MPSILLRSARTLHRSIRHTEEQISNGCLQNYDALYVLEPHVAQDVQSRITKWTRDGGLLWTSSNSLTHDEYNEPSDWLSREAAIQRTGESDQRSATMKPAPNQPDFQLHSVSFGHRFQTISADDAVTRATYDDGSPAWIEKSLGQGRVVYVGHRAGVTYSAQSVAIGGRPVIWADTGRATLTRPLHDATVARELVVSKPTVMATAQSTDDGTVIVLYNMRSELLSGLTVTLVEPARPTVVQTFRNDRLIDIPFNFANRQLTITLDRLDQNEGQMIVVRRTVAPNDPRLDVMQARATQLLQSDDPLDLSAGAWLAGFHTDWALAESVVPLLDHPRWEVRRSAAEALGRLGHQPAADRLSEVVKHDKDDHVRADAIHALALIAPQTFPEIASRYATHESMIVRLETMRAIKSVLDRTPTVNDAALVKAVEHCMSDPSDHIRHLAIALAGQLQPDRLVARALSDATSAADQQQWMTALANSDQAFEAFMTEAQPRPDDVVFSLALRRKDPRLASEVERRFLAGSKHASLINAVEFQRTEQLTRTVFEHRNQLDKAWQTRLAYQLETTLGRGLGRDLQAWARSFLE